MQLYSHRPRIAASSEAHGGIPTQASRDVQRRRVSEESGRVISAGLRAGSSPFHKLLENTLQTGCCLG